MDLRTFLKVPAVISVFRNSGKVTGITALGSDVFVVRGTSYVDVYSSASFTTRRRLPLPESAQLQMIVSCSPNNCLYVGNMTQKILYRYDLSNNDTNSWTVSSDCFGLSVTKCFNLLLYLTLIT